ncbi:MAG: HAD hydrolase family protein [Nitrososphaerota archaeon]|jgi:HAD superfamily hydrolase (TIGR01484 family)|nr:HAD hydrolase family protein [Nitrososphaerota archaeon]
MNKIDYLKYAMKTCESKNSCKPNVQDIADVLKSTFEKVYDAICLDIDGTITGTTSDIKDISPEMINIFKKLFNAHVCVFFVTGRGRKSATDFVKKIISSCELDEKTPNRWYCINGNGFGFLHTITDFWDNETEFVEITRQNKFCSDKDNLRSKIAKIISLRSSLDEEKIISDSKESNYKTSLIFTFDSILPNELSIVNYIKEYLANYSDYRLSKGKYSERHGGKYFLEVSCTSKGQTIKKVMQVMNISEDNVLRVGDQGDEWGIDHTMLNTNESFSVGTISKDNLKCCFPVLDYNNGYKVLKGSEGTTFLLKTIKLRPPVSCNILNREKI